MSRIIIGDHGTAAIDRNQDGTYSVAARARVDGQTRRVTVVAQRNEAGFAGRDWELVEGDLDSGSQWATLGDIGRDAIDHAAGLARIAAVIARGRDTQPVTDGPDSGDAGALFTGTVSIERTYGR